MITILLFAQLKEAVGASTLEFESGQTTVEALKGQLQTTYHTSQLDHVMTAVNEEYALSDDTIKPGDTVAFIPPVSGG